MKPLEILIKEEPIPKGRPRTSWKNGKVHTYNPDRTTFAQERITACLQQYKDKAFPPHVAIKLTCTFYRTKFLPINFIKCLSQSRSISLIFSWIVLWSH